MNIISSFLTQATSTTGSAVASYLEQRQSSQGQFTVAVGLLRTLATSHS